jgi:hypothetical protein
MPVAQLLFLQCNNAGLSAGGGDHLRQPKNSSRSFSVVIAGEFAACGADQGSAATAVHSVCGGHRKVQRLPAWQAGCLARTCGMG